MGRELRKADFTKLAGQTQLVYERNASRFANERPKSLIEKKWLDRFLKLVPENGNLLDLGCGAGQPIAAYFIRQGHRVVGLDASVNMIRLARENFPAGDWRREDMRNFKWDERFHGIIGWHSFFHLTRDEQRASLPGIAKHLAPQGALLLTVGPNDGEVEGRVGCDPVYHASLSLGEYREILSVQGLEIEDFVAEDPDCDGSTVLLARMAGG